MVGWWWRIIVMESRNHSLFDTRQWGWAHVNTLTLSYKGDIFIEESCMTPSVAGWRSESKRERKRESERALTTSGEKGTVEPFIPNSSPTSSWSIANLRQQLDSFGCRPLYLYSFVWNNLCSPTPHTPSHYSTNMSLTNSRHSSARKDFGHPKQNQR